MFAGMSLVLQDQCNIGINFVPCPCIVLALFFADIPDPSTWNLNPDASYVYLCDNETIHGKLYTHAQRVWHTFG